MTADKQSAREKLNKAFQAQERAWEESEGHAVSSYPCALCTRYAVSGTGLRGTAAAILLRACYALSGTDECYDATRKTRRSLRLRTLTRGSQACGT
eukprot:400148-Rhodomonas_salina.1